MGTFDFFFISLLHRSWKNAFCSFIVREKPISFLYCSWNPIVHSLFAKNPFCSFIVREKPISFIHCSWKPHFVRSLFVKNPFCSFIVRENPFCSFFMKNPFCLFIVRENPFCSFIDHEKPILFIHCSRKTYFVRSLFVKNQFCSKKKR